MFTESNSRIPALVFRHLGTRGIDDCRKWPTQNSMLLRPPKGDADTDPSIESPLVPRLLRFLLLHLLPLILRPLTVYPRP